jgi:hypothetical protein
LAVVDKTVDFHSGSEMEAGKWRGLGKDAKILESHQIYHFEVVLLWKLVEKYLEFDITYVTIMDQHLMWGMYPYTR